MEPPEDNTFCATIFNCYTVPRRHYKRVGLSPQQCARSLRDYEPNSCGEPIQKCMETCANNNDDGN